MKACTICSSLMPTACICAMRSLAGLEKLHSNMLHVATESLQPHWHCRRAPTRRTSTLGFWLAVWASATTATLRTNRLLLNRCIFLGIPYYFRAGVLQLDFARHQADQRAEDHYERADPDPRNQRAVSYTHLRAHETVLDLVCRL